MTNRNIIIIGKLIKYIVKVKEYSKNVDYDSFVSNTQLHEACILNLLQIGELITRLDEEFTLSYPEIPWIKIRGLRNKIAHDYESILIDTIWDIIQKDLEPLQEQLLQIESQLTK